jgi:hypothetical protein
MPGNHGTCCRKASEAWKTKIGSPPALNGIIRLIQGLNTEKIF